MASDRDSCPTAEDVASHADSSTSSESEETDDEDLLHVHIGAPTGCDPPPKQFFRLRDKYVAKLFAVDGQDHKSLFCGTVGTYNQQKKQHAVNYEDKTTFLYTANEVMAMIETFEYWYDKVSHGGRTMPRRKASPYIVKVHRREQIQKQAKKTKSVRLTSASASAAASATNFDDEDTNDEDEDDEDERAVAMGVAIRKMKVKELQQECAKAMLNESGLKAELQARLLEHYKCKDVQTEVRKGKHKCKWERKQFPAPPTPFTDEDFNAASLDIHLDSFPDAVPSPGECYDFYVTDEMWELGRSCTNMYPTTLRSQMQPPPWHSAKKPWPPKWTETPWIFTPEQFKDNTVALYMLGLKHKGKDDLRAMFGSDEFYREDWLKDTG